MRCPRWGPPGSAPRPRTADATSPSLPWPCPWTRLWRPSGTFCPLSSRRAGNGSIRTTGNGTLALGRKLPSGRRPMGL
eukprot:2383295-Lingulodinium_polyedra.AAC.1